ncbi:MAG: single-stranded-DNA-specific exonuclease RecJ [Bacteroidales bacterium]|nr:single-stranded-DNA-specific exonuclease RecJ [Bacteroidales bacterium]
MNRAWKIKERGNVSDINRLAEELLVSPVISNLLMQRGIASYDQAKNFFRPDLKDLYDPFLMKDMDIAVQRLELALHNKEKILVYGDYDVDGTTSVSMIYSFLRNYTSQVDYYIPDRYAEGYGISFKGVDYAINKGISLIIALDCGIKANDKVAYANEHRIDFVICDHHTPGDILPEACAILNPERHDAGYPFKYLSGCGVGFKFIQAYALKNNIPFEEIAKYLDLVAVSIASDIVPLIDENRILAHYGLKKLNHSPSVGLKSIIEVAGLTDKQITIDDIVFKIGPRINAAGRIESGVQAVELLVSENTAEAALHCEKINSHNQTRRNIDKTITEEALQEIGRADKYKYSTVLYNPGWHKGVVGIVASRLIESYYRPTIILTESNGHATGSARSIPGFDLYQAISECSSLLESFGGHMYAAGITLKVENIQKFRDRFEEVVKNSIPPEMLIPQVDIDAELNLNEISPKFLRILKQFEPFGPENLNPVFFAESVSDNGSARVVGADEEHLQLGLIQEDNPFTFYRAIAFNQASHLAKIKRGASFDIAYTVFENNFRGETSIQLNVKDIKIES